MSSCRGLRSDPFCMCTGFEFSLWLGVMWCCYLACCGEHAEERIPWQDPRNSVRTSRCWCSISASWLKAIRHTPKTWAEVPKTDLENCWVKARECALKLAKLRGVAFAPKMHMPVSICCQQFHTCLLIDVPKQVPCTRNCSLLWWILQRS